uniref:F-box domain-containing protein n=1 Tax=Tetranychus urticae TaxID=32264 RepID=T1KAB0_TETUR
MLINEIPDDCLLAIFDYINNLDDLLNCYKVCVKWSYLIAKRTKKTKYLISEDPGYSSDAVYYRGARPIDSSCLSRLFTNLIIAELSPRLHRKVEDAIEFVSKQKSLKGLINFYDEPIEKYCDKLEMLSVNTINPNNLRNGSSIKQLVVRNYSLEALKRDAHYLPNLERLKIQIFDVPDDHYDGPVLEKIKILELLDYYEEQPETSFHGFQFMDSCPNLQSAHIIMNTDSWFFDATLKHKCLQDLVIRCYEFVNRNTYGNALIRLLIKYPNLKHLALRGIYGIKDEHIKQLVDILPNLVLLDVIGFKEVTQRAADYVKDHCERNGRSTKFYFNGNCNEIKSDWPQLSSKHEIISRGFDFMQHCFRKDFLILSHFLIPIDY